MGWLAAVLGLLVFYRDELNAGQVNGWVFALLTFAFFGRSRHPVLAALALAIAVQFKLFALALLLPILMGKEYRTLALWISTLVASYAGGVLLILGFDFGIAETKAWLHSLTLSTGEMLLDYYNISFMAFVGKNISAAAARPAWLCLGLLFVAAAWRIDKRPDRAWSFGWVMFTIVIFTPLIWSYQFVLLLPSVLLILSELERRFSWKVASASALAIFSVCGLQNSHAGNLWINSSVILALSLAYFLLASWDKGCPIPQTCP